LKAIKEYNSKNWNLRVNYELQLQWRRRKRIMDWDQ
jgi:hypothetical protein